MLTGIQTTLSELVKLRYYAAGIHLSHHKRVSAKQQGLAASGFRGRGMDFDEVRVYQPGDEIRHMDSRVFARTGVPHTKLYKEERERPVYLIVDSRASMHFGTQVAFKSVVAAEAAALVAWAASKQGDRVGAVIFNEEQQLEITPQGRETGVMSTLKLLSQPLRLGNSTTLIDPLGKVLFNLRRNVKPGSILFIFSDFNHLTPEAGQYLTQLAQHNEIVASFIYDNLEAQLPPPNHYGFTDSDKVFNLSTHSKKLQADYSEQFQTRVAGLKKQFQQKRISWLEFSTHQEAASILRKGLGGRSRGALSWLK